MRGKISDIMGYIPIQDSPHGTDPQNILLGDPLKTLPQTGIVMVENPGYKVLKNRNIPCVVISSPSGPIVEVRKENENIKKPDLAIIPDLGIWKSMLY